MPRPHSKDKEKIRDETRHKLLAASLHEFAQNGFPGANINIISTSAGFAKGTIYNYFPSKRELMLALIDELAIHQTAFIKERMQQCDDPLQRLKCFFSAGIAYAEQFPTQMKVITNMSYSYDLEFKSQVLKSYWPLVSLVIQDVLVAGMASGDIRPVDKNLYSALLISLYLGSLSLLDAEGKVYMTADQLTDFVLLGIQARVETPAE